jgi:hypothetical protein
MEMVAIVDSKSASMPSSCKGTYRLVRVLDVPYWLAAQHELGKWSPVSVRDKNILRVIGQWGPCSVGKTERCSFQKALRAAKEVAERYNSAGDAATAEQIIGAGGSA